MKDTSCALPLSGVLKRLSTHLDYLAAEVQAIEHAISDELGASLMIGGDSVLRLQRLDFLRQSLEDLARLNLSISTQCSGSIDEQTSDQLSLSTTKELLVLAKPKQVDAPKFQIQGDVDLF